MAKHPADDDSPEMRRFSENLRRAQAVDKPLAESSGGGGGSGCMIALGYLACGSILVGGAGSVIALAVIHL